MQPCIYIVFLRTALQCGAAVRKDSVTLHCHHLNVFIMTLPVNDEILIVLTESENNAGSDAMSVSLSIRHAEVSESSSTRTECMHSTA